jgi:hypothetical protein
VVVVEEGVRLEKLEKGDYLYSFPGVRVLRIHL